MSPVRPHLSVVRSDDDWPMCDAPKSTSIVRDVDGTLLRLQVLCDRDAATYVRFDFSGVEQALCGLHVRPYRQRARWGHLRFVDLERAS